MSQISDLPAKQRILLTAHDLFYRDGIRATGIDRVIAESEVSKVTFYRHFPSKNDLILAFLEYRHTRWMSWFSAAIERNGNSMDALVPAMAEWFKDKSFRGCAFLNTVGELGGDLPEVLEIAQRHKEDMIGVVANLLPKSKTRDATARALAVAIDGAIVRAQYDPSPADALKALKKIVSALVPQSGT